MTIRPAHAIVVEVRPRDWRVAYFHDVVDDVLIYRVGAERYWLKATAVAVARPPRLRGLE